MEQTRKSLKGAEAEELREDRISEGERVTEIIEFGSVIPEREDLPYYIVSMAWFQRWQKYTGCLKVQAEEDEYGMEID